MVVMKGAIALVEYPPLFLHTDAAAGTGRRMYTRFVQLDLLLVVIGSAVSLIGSIIGGSDPRIGRSTVIAGAFTLFGSTVVKYINRHYHADRTWQDSRAIAESVKTATWRFMMCISPYNTDVSAAEATFLQTLGEVVHASGIRQEHINDLVPDARQITKGMQEAREEALPERRARYLQYRLTDQINWYLAKAVVSKRAATRWYWTSLVFQGGGFALTLLHALRPIGPNFAPLLLTLAATVVAWDQLGRNSELSKTYHLSAQDLASLRAAIVTTNDEETFTKQVTNAEEAISRENARWASKRG